MSQKELEDVNVEDLLTFYKKQQEQNERDFKKFEENINNIEVRQSEIKKFQWEIQDKNKKIEKLQELYEQSQHALIEERKNHLSVVSLNDKLKIKLQKKNSQIEYLATKAQENILLTEELASSSKSKRSRSSYDYQSQHDINYPEVNAKTKDLMIENEALSFSVDTMQIQLDEQKLNFEEMLTSLRLDLQSVKSTERTKNIEINRQLEESNLRIYNIQTLYRQNIREMLEMRKNVSENKKLISEDHFILRSKILSLESTLKSKQTIIDDLLKKKQLKEKTAQDKEIEELEYRLSAARADLQNLQSENEIREVSYKQSISRMELLYEKLQQDLSITKKDHAFYLNSIFAECVEIKKLLSEAHKTDENFMAYIDTFSDNVRQAIAQDKLLMNERVKSTSDKLDNLMLYIQRCKTGLNGIPRTSGSTPRKMKSVFDIVPKSNYR
ncbi:hypothetical protein BB561_001139 [Smittium simulii]|uniref:Uncharacterized protein n=1 Tax=Smittium simulii TaxID=133385 RepID=A0A2T9YW22_9FUNG|nr:hypothetical protein BB561_001139 [Smittium simulii]